MRFLLQLSSSKWAAERVWKKAMGSDLLMSKNTSKNANISDRYVDAQRRCRAGLGILMHSTVSLYNFYISQIHMHILPSFSDYHRHNQYTLSELKNNHLSVLRMIKSLIIPIEKNALKITEGAYTAAKLLQHAVLFNENDNNDAAIIIQKERYIFDVEIAMLQLRSLVSEFTSELSLICKKYNYDYVMTNSNDNNDNITDRNIVMKLKELLVTLDHIYYK
jgi:hypothetical protein